MVIAIDVYAAYQVKRTEEGDGLMAGDATGATDNSNDVHHISVLISRYADLYIKQSIYIVKPADSYTIAKDVMTLIADTDNLSTSIFTTTETTTYNTCIKKRQVNTVVLL